MNRDPIPYTNLINFAGLTLVVVVTLLLMIFGRAIILPMIIAVVITFIINAISFQFMRVQIGGYHMPQWVAQVITIVLFGLGVRSLLRMSVSTVQQMLTDSATIIENLNRLLNSLPQWILEFLPSEMLTQESVYDVGSVLTFGIDYFSVLMTQYLTQAAFIAGQSLIILVYVIFLLVEQRIFSEKIGEMFSDEDSNRTIQRVLSSINKMVQTYFSVKTYVSLMVGGGSFIVMWFFGLDNALFWAILIYLFNYIPYVGSVVGVVIPVLFSLTQFGDWTMFVLLSGSLSAIQIIAGSLIEPQLAGRMLDISPFVVFASITTFGTIWGVTGMFLAVPLVIIMIITFSHFEATRPIAVLLSGRGKISAFEPKVVVKRRRPPTFFSMGD